MRPSHSLSPPGTLRGKVKFLGPGIIFAAMAVGSGELILTPRSGALFGYALAWVAVITLVYKVAFTEGLARCTVATGEDIFIAFASLPGPRNWANWLIIALFTLEALAYGGMALACGTALHSLFPEVTMRQGALGIILAIPFILGSGSYPVFEKIMLGMATVLITGVLYATYTVQFEAEALLLGMVPTIPDDSIVTIMGLMGWVGAGIATLLYSVWVKEKIGLARNAQEYREWMTTVRIDYLLSYALILLFSLCFLNLGAATLHTQGLEPRQEETMEILSRMLSSVPYGQPIFLVTGFFTLLSTLLAGIDGRARAFASAAASMRVRSSRIQLYRATMGVYLIVMSGAILLGQPVFLIRTVSATVSVAFGFLGFMLLYVDRRLPEYARGSMPWRLTIGLGSLVFLFVAIYRLST